MTTTVTNSNRRAGGRLRDISAVLAGIALGVLAVAAILATVFLLAAGVTSLVSSPVLPVGSFAAHATTVTHGPAAGLDPLTITRIPAVAAATS